MYPARTWWFNSGEPPPGRVRSRGSALFILFSFLLFCTAGSLRAAIQFDVFLGYDGIVPEASWFPLTCEGKNDGPSFTGTVEVSSGNQGQTRRITVELPTGTKKLFHIPVFSNTAQSYS